MTAQVNATKIITPEFKAFIQAKTGLDKPYQVFGKMLWVMLNQLNLANKLKDGDLKKFYIKFGYPLFNVETESDLNKLLSDANKALPDLGKVKFPESTDYVDSEIVRGWVRELELNDFSKDVLMMLKSLIEKAKETSNEVGKIDTFNDVLKKLSNLAYVLTLDESVVSDIDIGNKHIGDFLMTYMLVLLAIKPDGIELGTNKSSNENTFDATQLFMTMGVLMLLDSGDITTEQKEELKTMFRVDSSNLDPVKPVDQPDDKPSTTSDNSVELNALKQMVATLTSEKEQLMKTSAVKPTVIIDNMDVEQLLCGFMDKLKTNGKITGIPKRESEIKSIVALAMIDMGIHSNVNNTDPLGELVDESPR